jgi:hypothetical protein
MANIKDVYGSGKYLVAADLQGKRVAAVIAGAAVEAIGQDQRRKIVLTLTSPDGRRWPKRAALNVTNANNLASALGEDSNDWIGHRIELWAEPTTYQGKPMQGLRCAAVGNRGTAGSGPSRDAPHPPSDPLPGSDLDDEIPF